MINPHLCYIAGFSVSLLVYQLGWSEIYPKLSFALVGFLVLSMGVHLVLSRKWNKHFQRLTSVTENDKLNPWIGTVVLCIFLSIDFIHEGGIPLLKILRHVPYDYKQFGVPVLHVFNVSFGSFFCIYLLDCFLRNKKKEYFLLYLFNMSAAILIYSRAMLFFNLASSVFLYLLFLQEIPYKKILMSLPAILILFYFFGVAGTKRVSSESAVVYDHNLFLDNGKATQAFRQSMIPKEFFWSYFYISSPLANLQVNINTFNVRPITFKRALEFINNEILFESVSKRINVLLGVERETENVIKEPFNVSTVYSRSYSYLAWPGIITMAIFLFGLPFLYLYWIKDSHYRNVGIALLCCSYLFLSYDNTIRLMGLGFELVYPVLVPFVAKIVSLKSRTS